MATTVGFRSQAREAYAGVLFHHWRVLLLMAAVLCIASVAFWIFEANRIWLEGWFAFWRKPSLALWGVLVLLAPVLLMWLVVPAAMILSSKAAAGYVRYRADDSLHITVLLTASIVGMCSYVPIVPTLAILTWSDYSRSATALLSFSSALTAVGIVRRFRAFVGERNERYRIPVRQFPAELRPQNTRVLNADCGALAPRLNVVADGLDAWSRLVNGSAPTAKLWWEAVSEARGCLPPQWQKSLKGRAWTGIEAFRRTIAELVQVDPASVVLLPSTTRSCQAILHSLPNVANIVTTTMEHPSQERLLSSFARTRGSLIRRVDTFRLLEEGLLFRDAPKLFAREVQQAEAPIVLFSEVPYTAGVRLPVAEIIKAVRAASKSAIVIVDGAHAVGHLPVNVAASGSDYYVFSGHKWLFGPASLGVCVVGERIRRNSELYERLSLECYESLAMLGSRLGESGSTIPLEPFVGLAEFLGTVTQNGIINDIYENIFAIRRLLASKADPGSSYELIQFTGIQADRVAPGIANVQAKGARFTEAGLHAVRDMLEERFLVVTKVVTQPTSLRVCLPFYLNYMETERLHTALNTAFSTVIPVALPARDSVEHAAVDVDADTAVAAAVGVN